VFDEALTGRRQPCAGFVANKKAPPKLFFKRADARAHCCLRYI
jgi:hypothetical protein